MRSIPHSAAARSTACAPKSDAVRRRLRDAHDHRLRRRSGRRRCEHAAATAHQPSRPPDRGSRKGQRGRTSTRTSSRGCAASLAGLGEQVDVDQERAAADDRQHVRRAAGGATPGRAACARGARRTSASVAARRRTRSPPPRPPGPRAAHRGRRVRSPYLGQDRQPVDCLLLGSVGARPQLEIRVSSSSCGHAW